MELYMSSLEKREGVKNNYNLIAKQYSEEFGEYIEDIDIYEKFEEYLNKDFKILDLGAGSGRTYSYFSIRGYKYIGLDFSKEMKECAYQLHGEFPYIVDDMINIKKYFSNESIDAIFAVYSLFHLPMDDLTQLFLDMSNILKKGGILLFSYQLGNYEEMTNEPYLKEQGKKVLYMNYQTEKQINELLNKNSFERLYRKEKIETFDSAINSNNAVTVFEIVKKI